MEYASTEHPYNNRYPIPPETKVLIVGTAPPPRFCKRPWSCEDELDFDFFYGSGSNWMWGILPQALNEPKALPETLSAKECEEKAINLLKRHRLWMLDVLARVTRKPGKENSAKDSDIATPKDADFANFKTIFDQAPNLVAITTTSEAAFSWLMQALKFQELTAITGKTELNAWKAFSSPSHSTDTTEFWIDKHSRPLTTLKLRENDRKIDVYILPSPSSLRSAMTLECKTQVYRNVLELERYSS